MDTTEAALLAAIRAEPDDDTVRLVYADYVQGRDGPGDAEFAEFVRVQCELVNPEPSLQFLATQAMRPFEVNLNSRHYLEARRQLRDHQTSRETLRARERKLWPTVRGRFEGAGWTPFYRDWDLSAKLRPVLIVRRGLPAEVRGLLAVLVGGECSCGIGCSACHGTDTTPGIVAELRRQWPVVRAVAADKRPSEWSTGANAEGREFIWERSMSDQPNPEIFHRLGRGPFDPDGDDEAATIPPTLFDMMVAGGFGVLGMLLFVIGKYGYLRFTNESAAIDALSAAIIAHADEQNAKGVEHADR